MSAAVSSRVDYWSWQDSPVTWNETNTTWDTASRVYYEADIDEKVALTDRASVSADVLQKETVRIGDMCMPKAKTKRSWQETVAVSDAKKAGYESRCRESIKLRERFNKTMSYNMRYDESVAVGEMFSRRAIYAERRLPEHFGVSDNAGKSVELIKNESLGRLSDAFLENANAVIDMVSFYDGVMDKNTFLDRANTVNGYSAFKEFYVGDYEYQRALVRLSVKAEQMNSGINLYNVVHNVDIPDTDDRGTVVITDTTASTKVYFNKFYYHAPEVSVTLIGGNTGDGIVMPVVTSLDGKDDGGRYFEVELLDMSGARKTGTVTWVSKGY